MMWWLVLVAVVRAAAPAPWWGDAAHYRVLVDSFKDGDGDGLGDLKGLANKLSYIKALGADSVILSPLVSKSADCSKPGVLDFTVIDQRYGSFDDFNVVLEKTKALELKLVVSLPLQTMSEASEWVNFDADKASGFEDWLVWEQGSADEPPPPTGEISWTWNEGRSSFYATTNSEVLLNLCSEAVKAALSSAQCAWLRRGVSGVLLNPDFPLDQKCGEQLLKKLAADAMSCVRSANLETPVIMVETSLPPELSSKYFADGGAGANTVLSRSLSSAVRRSSDTALNLYASILNAPEDGVVTWMTSATNESRIATRYGSEMIDAINLLNLVLPGAAIIQQGDELGAADTILEWATSTNCWPSSMQPCLAPFPWDDTANGGFSNTEPWMPLAPNYRYANAKTEFANDFSHVGVVRVAAVMRKSPAMGPHAEIKRLGGGAIAVLRWGGTGSLLVVSNIAPDQTEVQLSKIPGLPAEMTIAASSGGSSLSAGSHHNLEKTLKMAPGESVLLVGPPRHCGGPGPVDKIANKLNEGWQKLNKYFSNI